MKKILLILFTASILISCKSNSSIITSKYDAKKKGVYSKVPSTRSTESVNAVSFKNSDIKSTNNFESKPSDILNVDFETRSSSYSETGVIFSKDIISEAKNYLGVRYKFGGTTRAGMDCSGFVSTVFKQFDFTLPRTSKEMAKIGTTVTKNNIEPGDLVFFKTNRRSVINHVGIVVSVTENEFKFIHSSTSKGVIISSNSEPYYKRAFAQANRIL